MSDNTFIWTGDANNGEFGDAKNWSDTTSSTAGPPEVEAGKGSVAAGQETIFSSATSKRVLGNPASFAGSLTYSGQTLTVHESGGASVALRFAGPYTQSSFGMTSDGHSGTFITRT